ncbi:MAG TPA: aconitase family protein [candidate division Zixibacteria bacterium]|nr:aconitase family protein [candidate division Zixibacteria bacterium]
MKPPRRIPTKKELERLQKLYKTDERIAERLGNVPVYLVAYWRRKRNVATFSAPKFSEQEINTLWERFGSDDRCGAELGISRAAFNNWRRKYGITRKPAFLKLEQMEFQFPGKEFTSQRARNYGKRPAALKTLWEKRDGRTSSPGEVVEAPVDLVVLGRDAALACAERAPEAPLASPQRTALSLGGVNGYPGTVDVQSWAKRQRLSYLYGPADGSLWSALERDGATLPGRLIVCERGNERFAGARGALAWGLAPEELAETARSGIARMATPQVAHVILTGKRYSPISAIDITLQLLAELSDEALTDSVLEFSGNALRTFSIPERESLCAVSALSEARSALAPCDAVTRRHIAALGSWSFAALTPDKDADYHKTFQLNIEVAGPMAAWLHADAGERSAASQSSLDFNGSGAREVTAGTDARLTFHTLETLSAPAPDIAFIGGSPGGQLDELRRAAEILRGSKISEGLSLFISPLSQDIYLQALKKGYIRQFVEAGAIICRPGIDSAELGSLGVSPDATVVTAAVETGFIDRAFAADRFLTSAAATAAAAVTGRLVDPRGV